MDPYIGTLVNEYLGRGGRARAILAGERYPDAGTTDGYRRAMQLPGDAPPLASAPLP